MATLVALAFEFAVAGGAVQKVGLDFLMADRADLLRSRGRTGLLTSRPPPRWGAVAGLESHAKPPRRKEGHQVNWFSLRLGGLA